MKDTQSLPKTGHDAQTLNTFASAQMPKSARVVVLTISDGCSQGLQQDRSGPAVAALLESAGATAMVRETLPDELELPDLADVLPARRSSGRRIPKR